jgi:flagellar basal body rod protein FlgG
MRSLDIAGTGMQAQQTNVEVISDNMANMTTTGFKRRRAEFQDLIYQNPVVTEITNLITAQRAYEMNSKVITSSDEMMSTLTNLR